MTKQRARRAGVLAHITSLPGPYACGTLGPEAREFARAIGEMGMSVWQMLPITPTEGSSGFSPYSSPSAFAGNASMISPDDLVRDGLITHAEAERAYGSSCCEADLEAAAISSKRAVEIAHERFRDGDAYKTTFAEINEEFWRFCSHNAWWLEDYALFTVLKGLSGGAQWTEWRAEYKHRDWSELDPLKKTRFVARELDRVRFEQFLFFKQLGELKAAAAEAGVALVGDMPIYVAHDSADVWGHRDLFELDSEGEPVSVAGVPPDLFSETGQRWGSPLYRWNKMRDDGWSWWMGRVARSFDAFDMVRIDHFRGLIGYWAIPASEETAINGEWRPGPGVDFVRELVARFGRGSSRFIAEDLGVITDDVREAMADAGLPGMKVLHFAFGSGMPDGPYAPHNHEKRSVVYTGTHDNDTTRGWWKDASDVERSNFIAYLGGSRIGDDEICERMIRLALSSVADLAVIPAQDILGLGSEARMNTPSTVSGNWSWRMGSVDELTRAADELDLRSIIELYGRADARDQSEE